MRQLALWGLLITLASACADSDEHTPGADPMAGTWVSKTWKLAMEAHAGTAVWYEFTSVSCLPYAMLEYEDLSIPALGATGRIEGDELVLELLGSGELRATKVDALPEMCDGGGTPFTDDPQLSFEVYWHAIEEMYASFDIHTVDWQAQHDAHASQVTSTTTTDELLEVLCAMSAPLNDPHVNLSYGDGGCPTKPLPAWLQPDEADAMVAAVEAQAYGDDSTVLASGAVSYRRLDDGLGYLLIVSMGGAADQPSQDQAAFAAALDAAVEAFADAPGVIVDVRFNGGGDDAISLLIADRFADQERLAFSVQTRDGDGWTPTRQYYIHPEGPAQLTQPVVMLTSAYTVSAAETFVMAMEELPNVTSMGETTCGGHSNAMNRNLPDGIAFTVPFERTYAADGVCYEGIGLAPEVAEPFDAQAYINGDDSMLAAARDRLEGN